MAEPKAKEGQATTVRMDGEQAVMHITDQSVMFEKGGKVSGFLRSAIQLVKPDGDTMLIAYSVGSEVKSVRIEPITALTSLLIPTPQSGSNLGVGAVPAAATALDEVFERLYRETRKELEERLAKVMEEPENMSLRLTPDEEERLDPVFGQMMRIIRAKHSIDEDDPSYPLATWSLHEQPFETQLEVVKAWHIAYLTEFVGPRAETADIGYTSTGIWPQDMEHILIHYKLTEGPFLTAGFKNHLKSKWKRPENKRKPVIASYT